MKKMKMKKMKMDWYLFCDRLWREEWEFDKIEKENEDQIISLYFLRCSILPIRGWSLWLLWWFWEWRGGRRAGRGKWGFSSFLHCNINKNELKMNSISKNRRMRSQIMKIITISCMIETLDSIKDSLLLKFLHFLIWIF